MPKNIEQEIDQAADEMAKSTQTAREKLFETIRQLGPEGIKAKLPTLEKAEKELLISALAEMKKAVEMDKNYAAKFVQGNIKDTVLQEDKADDNQDEKLVMDSAATVNHQGTPTPGWEGQVIKAKEPGEKKEKKAEKKVAEAVDAIAEDEAKEKVKDHEDKMHGKKQAKKVMKKGDMPFGDLKDDKKSKDQKKDALKKIKKSVEDQLKEAGVEPTPELVKSEMKRLLAEESQNGDAPEMNEKTRANKESAPALDLGKDSKAAQADVGKNGAVKKAVWGGENDLLKANTNGRNHHFSINDYIDQVLAEAAKPAEQVQKSEGEPKEDLNDIIAKGGDANWDMVNTDRLLKANTGKISGTLVKSFQNKEIQEALGLTDEEAKKILGE